jgi:hypothetical protein
MCIQRIGAGWRVGNVIVRDGLPFVIEAEAVVFHVVIPDTICRAATREFQYCGGNSGVWPENTGRHRDNRLKPVLFDQLSPSFDVRPTTAKKDAVRGNRGAPLAGMGLD